MKDPVGQLWDVSSQHLRSTQSQSERPTGIQRAFNLLKNRDMYLPALYTISSTWSCWRITMFCKKVEIRQGIIDNPNLHHSPKCDAASIFGFYPLTTKYLKQAPTFTQSCLLNFQSWLLRFSPSKMLTPSFPSPKRGLLSPHLFTRALLTLPHRPRVILCSGVPDGSHLGLSLCSFLHLLHLSPNGASKFPVLDCTFSAYTAEVDFQEPNF